MVVVVIVVVVVVFSVYGVFVVVPLLWWRCYAVAVVELLCLWCVVVDAASVADLVFGVRCVGCATHCVF